MNLFHLRNILRNKQDPNYIPKTCLMDELTPGIYEIVFTNLLGGVLMRYRVGDLLNFISLEDEDIGCKIPQFRFYSRGDDLIDISAMVRFNEKDIWVAMEESSLQYVDWTARKETENGKSVVHLYVEYRDGETMSVGTGRKFS